MLNDIPKNRILIWGAVATLIPILISFLSYYSKEARISEVKDTIEYVKDTSLTKERKQALNKSVRHYFKETDRFYVDKNLESLKFLQPEVKSLQELVNNKNFAGDEKVKRRLEFLTGDENKLLMSEGNIVTYPYFQEVTSTLSKPVEVNLDDLLKILTLVEGVEIPPHKTLASRPQLIVLNLKFDRKEGTDKNQVYVLNLKFLKREFN